MTDLASKYHCAHVRRRGVPFDRLSLPQAIVLIALSLSASRPQYCQPGSLSRAWPDPSARTNIRFRRVARSPRSHHPLDHGLRNNLQLDTERPRAVAARIEGVSDILAMGATALGCHTTNSRHKR